MNHYIHKVQYYETDRMNFVHHSNYLRWFEESRADYLEKIGLPYEQLEARGFFSPVVGIECQYHRSCSFGDTVDILTALLRFGHVNYTFGYRVVNHETGVLLATGTTTHCFLDAGGLAVSLKRSAPELAARFSALAQSDSVSFVAI